MCDLKRHVVSFASPLANTDEVYIDFLEKRLLEMESNCSGHRAHRSSSPPASHQMDARSLISDSIRDGLIVCFVMLLSLQFAALLLS